MKQTQNQFFGLKTNMPSRMEAGSTYLCEDTKELFLYGQGNNPVLINGEVDILLDHQNKVLKSLTEG